MGRVSPAVTVFVDEASKILWIPFAKPVLDSSVRNKGLAGNNAFQQFVPDQ